MDGQLEESNSRISETDWNQMGAQGCLGPPLCESQGQSGSVLFCCWQI